MASSGQLRPGVLGIREALKGFEDHAKGACFLAAGVPDGDISQLHSGSHELRHRSLAAEPICKSSVVLNVYLVADAVGRKGPALSNGRRWGKTSGHSALRRPLVVRTAGVFLTTGMAASRRFSARRFPAIARLGIRRS